MVVLPSRNFLKSNLQFSTWYRKKHNRNLKFYIKRWSVRSKIRNNDYVCIEHLILNVFRDFEFYIWYQLMILKVLNEIT